ncbi:DUF3108 domain-containing protein [Actimicrobium antarcticum]
MIITASPENLFQRWRNALVIVTVSLLLHLLAFNWASSRLGHPVERVRHEEVVTILLSPIAEPVPVPAPPPPPKPAPAKPRVVRPAVVSPVAKAAADIPADLPAPVAQEAATDVVATAATVPQALPDPVIAPEPVAVAVATVVEPEPVRIFKTAPPPSAEVKYDVQALRDAKTVYGSGKISWQSAGDTYQINGEAGVLFFTVLGFRSEGSLGDDGITPLRYSEKRFRKAETNTHFQRENKVISFSASTATYPRNGGEQDRASIVWQLAAIGRGDAAQFAAGTELDFFVAGVRDAETWHIKVIGEEQLALGGTPVTAWHFLRTPRPGSYDTQVEFWLAPSREWYPVRLRQTETNGDTLTMSMSSITPLASR